MSLANALNANIENCKEFTILETAGRNEAYIDKKISSKNIEKIFFDFYTGPRSRDSIYINNEGEFVTRHRGNTLVIPKTLLENVVSQIDSAINYGFGEFLFFPDFGHGHFQIPEGASEISSLEVLLKKNDFIILYHSLESYSANSYFREANRNFFGYSKNERVLPVFSKDGGRTVFTVPGYKKTNYGIYIRANKKGCFYIEKEGGKIFFDLEI